MNANYRKKSWRLKELLMLTWVFILFGSTTQGQIYSSQSGDWSVPSTWVGGMTPSSSDKVIIQAGHNVTLYAAISLDDSLKVNGTLTLPGSITGTGHKLILPGGNFILQGGGLYGSGEWIILAGALMDIQSGGSIGSTSILRNHGTINLNGGDINPTYPYSCYYGAPPPALLYNETSGTLNIQAATDINLGYTQIHNYGVVNKLNANTLTLSAACAGSPFYNYPGATFNLSFGQLVLYSGGSLQGIVNIGGILTINSAIDLGGQVSLTGSLYNNGTITSLAGLVISGNGYFNNTGLLNLISDVSFPFDIENTGTIGGSGIKTYLSGIEVNMNAGH
ncbi:MAG: hypothetical protein IPN29_08830 [Saprospiraceae bacterium]|nr:hypothetical protein [Saprospiraceae bacterium]